MHPIHCRHELVSTYDGPENEYRCKHCETVYREKEDRSGMHPVE